MVNPLLGRADRDSCSPCPAGWFGDDGVGCQRCGRGREPTALLAALACRPCAAAEWSPGDRPECLRCPDPAMVVDGPGTAADEAADCRCPDGTYDATVYAELRCWPDGPGQTGLNPAAVGALYADADYPAFEDRQVAPGRLVPLHHRSSTLHQIREAIRHFSS